MDNKGFATIESVALITVFSVLVSYAIGMFVIIHTGILNSIAARTYAWETFSHRTNLNFFRDNRSPPGKPETTLAYGYRTHSIISENSAPGDEGFFATERYIASAEPEELIGRNAKVHANLEEFKKRQQIGVNPVWIKTAYGICLTAKCGD